MTRFARAKGSKSSNERAPEDSTPWEVMKDQLLNAKKESEEAKKREEAEKQRIENYENFLKEHKSQKRKSTWCEFPDTESNKVNSLNVEPPIKKKKNKKHQNKAVQLTLASNTPVENSGTGSSSKKSKKKKQLKLKSAEMLQSSQEKQNITEQVEPKHSNSEENGAMVDSPKKKLKKQKKKKLNSEEASETNQLQYGDQSGQQLQNKNKKHKKNKKQKIVSEVGFPTHDNENNFEVDHNTKNSKPNQNNSQPQKSKNSKKWIDGLPQRRKPINDHSFQLIINGKEVELVRFDGFPIMKRDAERLEELKNNMINKGIPKSEVNRTLKLERRRAEKALARLKRDVCYNCRKGGHNLSDCPELKTKIPGVGAPDGVCFKCGSTEHRQFECKVQKDKEFRFATCFICKEPGHIARQCPDNPKGLYPNGGGCKLCGDVTHLRKDCPTMMGKKEENSIKLQTLDSTGNLEGIEQRTSTTSQETTKKPKKIKF